MSTYVYVSRRADPFDEDGPNITAEEWEDCAANQRDFRCAQGSEFEFSGEHAKVWTEYSVPVVFDWNEGQIEVKNPDSIIIGRMKRLADELRATVFSENGEIFNNEGMHDGFLEGFP